jgi:Tfp pilus assembly protein PilX
MAIHTSTRNDRGSALLFALGFMTVVLVIALGVHTLVGIELRAAGTQRRRVAAEYLAEGALARSIGWFNTTGYRVPQTSLLTAAVPVSLAANNNPVVLPSNHPNGYTDAGGAARSEVVTSFNASLTSQSVGGGSYSVTASLMNTAPETWEVVANAQQGGVQRRVGGLLIREQTSFFNSALFGSDSLSLNGNANTDAYDSTKGAYGGSNRTANGDIGSNGNITLKGNATINGNATAGPNMTTTMTGNAAVTGSTTPASTVRSLDAVSVPAGTTDLGAIGLSGNHTQTLTSGTYVASSISIGGDAKLIIDASSGPVNIYVTGAISAAGNGIANGSGNPQNLFIAQVGGGDVTYSGNLEFFGSIYAPSSALTLNGNATLYGAFVGKSISSNGNGAIHYDQSLQNLSGPPGPLRLVAQWNLLS